MSKYVEEKEDYILKETNGEVITVRDLQLEILKIMDEIDRVCRKNNIDYALHAGSALGAVNYGGFIPWDDDIDVIVKKEDYLRLIEAFKKDLSDKFDFQCYETDKKYNVLINQMKVRLKNSYIEEVNTLLKNRCDGSNGIFIDISWYGNVSESKFIDQLHRTVIKLLVPLYIVLDNIHIPHNWLKKFITWFSNRYSDKNKNSKYASQTIAIPWEKFMKEPIFLKTDIYPFKDCEFEGRTYKTYNNPEKVLKEWYGERSVKVKRDGKWVDLYPKEKRVPKHVKDIKLKLK